MKDFVEGILRPFEDLVEHAWAAVAIIAVGLFAVSAAWFVYAMASREVGAAFALAAEIQRTGGTP